MPKFLHRPGYFPQHVLDQARHAALTDEEFEKREEVPGITIDGPTSLDLDDAIALEWNGNNPIALISIADVGSVVEPGTPLDNEAIARLFTRYLRNGNLPMFPHEISERKMSLLPGQLRPTVTVGVELSPELEILNVNLRETKLRSAKKFDYASADKAMRDPADPHHAMLRDCGELAGKLLQKRREKGALAIYDLRQNIRTNEEGTVKALGRDERYRSNIVIQEFMLLANEAVARYCKERDVPILYRNHATMMVKAERSEIMRRIYELLERPQQQEDTELKQVLGRATYGPSAKGHFALNMEAYTHFTSPIRRYSDLVVHRMVKALIQERPLPYTHDRLRDIGEYINESIRSVADDKEEAHKERDHERRRAMILRAMPASMERMSTDELSKLLKRACKDDVWSEAFIREVQTRCASDRLEPPDVYFLLFGGVAPPELRAEAQGLILRQPHYSKSVLQILMTRHPETWQGYACKIHEARAGFAAQAVIGLEGELFSTPYFIVSDTKKDAEQQAAISLMFGHIDGTLVPADQTKMPAIAHQERPAAEKGPVPLLFEFCDLRRLPRPNVYATQTGGSAHRPVFKGQAAVKIEQVTMENDPCEGGSKRDAENAAAESLLRKLREAFPEDAKRAPPRKTRAPDYNAVGELQEFAQKHLKRGWSEPIYTFTDHRDDTGKPFYTCTGYISFSDGKKLTEWTTEGCTSYFKKDAKQIAADQLLFKTRKQRKESA